MTLDPALNAFELSTGRTNLPSLGQPAERTRGGTLSDRTNATLCVRWPPKGSGRLSEQLSHDAFSALPSQWSTAHEVFGGINGKIRHLPETSYYIVSFWLKTTFTVAGLYIAIGE